MEGWDDVLLGRASCLAWAEAIGPEIMHHRPLNP
jgi:hypothetical protein